MKRRYKLLLALLVLIGVPYYWLLIDNRPGDGPGAQLDIAELRRLAESIPGPKPEAVAVQTVGWRRVPGTLFVAGGGLKRNLLTIQAGLLSGPWGEIVIDGGFGAQDAEEFGLEAFRPDHQARVDAAMRRARRIVFTHEHLDHIGGLLRLPDFAQVAPKALITPEQMRGNRWADGLPWPRGARESLRAFRYSGMTAIAPGVVLIRTPGHTPGSQMVYARLADGREALFAGDTATMERSWRQVRARSRLVGDLMVGEDRAAVFAWLKAVNRLHRENPELIVIAGHDEEALRFAKPPPGIAFEFPAP
ncbi:MAG: MBL fold metallo-hydrolase [Novosphingobium sp.]|nr:MBL fold metallo-hydrolase [Novosphingobium sp.]